MPAKTKKYYAYAVPGGSHGVTSDWTKCEALVKGKADARYRAFKERAAAEAWLAAGAVYEPRPRAVLAAGVYFDAGTGRGNGVEISVTDEKGKDLLHKALPRRELNRFGKHLLENEAATNNYGELLALRYALEIARKMRIRQVFGDSKLVIEYWSRRRFKRKELPVETVALAEEVSALRDAFEKEGGAVARVSGDHNPADLGFH